MSKTLSAIQAISKIAKVISKVIYICCIVGVVGCIVGIIVLSTGIQGFRLMGEDLSVLIFNKSGLNSETLINYCIAGLITCTAECILCKFAVRYFDNELRAGTPFTYEGSKEILRLGILTIAIPIAAAIATGIACGIFSAFFSGAENLEHDNADSVTMGVLFIMASLVFRYGAELEKEKNITRIEK